MSIMGRRRNLGVRCGVDQQVRDIRMVRSGDETKMRAVGQACVRFRSGRKQQAGIFGSRACRRFRRQAVASSAFMFNAVGW